jgi:hypothetical protein
MNTQDTNDGHMEKLGAKFEKSIAQTLRGFSEARGEKLSTVLRRSVRRELARHSYLTDDDKKALGVEKGDSDE